MGFADRANAGLGETIHARGGTLVTDYVEGLSTVLELTDFQVGPTDRGWSPAVDLDVTLWPAWLGQALGVTVPPEINTLEGQRDYVRDRPTKYRGTRQALVDAIFPLLTGTQAVGLVERDGSPWQLTIRVFNIETTHTAEEIAAAAETQKPVGIEVTVELVSDLYDIPTRWYFPDVQHLSYAAMDHDSTYSDLAADFDSYADLADFAGSYADFVEAYAGAGADTYPEWAVKYPTYADATNEEA